MAPEAMSRRVSSVSSCVVGLLELSEVARSKGKTSAKLRPARASNSASQKRPALKTGRLDTEAP